MPNFPALSPGSRVFSPGEYPQAAYQSIDGQRINVAHSTAMFGSRLELGFIALTEAEMLSIFQHYSGQLGTFQSFQVPTAIFDGFPDLVIGTGSGSPFADQRWRYSGPPQVEEFASDVNVIRYSVMVTLETAPAQGAAVAGAALTVRFSLAAGAATASSAVAGADLTLTLSLEAGTATGS